MGFICLFVYFIFIELLKIRPTNPPKTNPQPPSHHFPLGSSGASMLVKENASPIGISAPPLGRHHPAALEHKLGKVQGGTGEGEEELEMFASK